MKRVGGFEDEIPYTKVNPQEGSVVLQQSAGVGRWERWFSCLGAKRQRNKSESFWCVKAGTAFHLDPMKSHSHSIPRFSSPTRALRTLSLGVLTLLAISGAGLAGSDDEGKKSAQQGVKILSAKQYEATALTIPGQLPVEEGGWTELLGVNDKGTLVGGFATQPSETEFLLQSGFILADERLTVVNVPGAPVTGIIGVNNREDVVGYYLLDDLTRLHSYTRTKHGVIVTLPDAAVGEFSFTQASSINGAGVVVGTCGSELEPIRAFVYRNGEYTYFEHPGAVETWFWGLNDHGDVSGFWLGSTGSYQGFVLTRNGEILPVLPPVPGAYRVLTRPINDRGEVYGTYRTDDTSEGGFEFIMDVFKGTFTPIVKSPEDGLAVIGGMNNRGTVVGVGTDLATGLLSRPVRKPVRTRGH